MSSKSKFRKLGPLFCLCLILWGSSASPKGDPADQKEEYYSPHLKATISYHGCPKPEPTEQMVLPYMNNHMASLKDKTVLDIGTGSGIMGLYAAKLGAKKVVSTDIDKAAIKCTQKNSKRLNFSDVIDVRYVPPRDMSAYAVIKPDETFDFIICNPPGSLVLEATRRQRHIAENGDLGFSIIRGLDKHLKPDGKAILYYDDFFYQEVIVKFARYMGYEVKQYAAARIERAEADAIFNFYLAEVLKAQNVPSEAFKFNLEKDSKLDLKLFRGDDIAALSRPYRGLVIIQRKK